MAEKRAKPEPKRAPKPKREPRTASNAEGGPAIDARSPKSLGVGQWLACAVAVVIALAGGGLWAYAAATGEEPPIQRATDASDSGKAGGGGNDLASGFVGSDSQTPRPGDTDAPDASVEDAAGQRWLDTWSPAIFRLGFSFFVGFAIGYALRAFVKITLIILGAGFLGLFLLQYAGVVDVNWGLLEGHYDDTVAWLKREASSFTEFAKGYLPSGASALAGLVIGFRRKR